jgi:hopanoid biosynthesis associated protein HpnK
MSCSLTARYCLSKSVPRPEGVPGTTAAKPSWLIINADDFGMASSVNAAVEVSHKRGVLTAASLMVGAPAAGEAVQIARRMPSLRVGLHLVVADGWASLPPAEVSWLADADGVMDARVLARSFRLLRPAVYRQLRAEIKAQFHKFSQTGLPLDHVNVHKHLHMHPLILRLVMDETLAHGSPPVRIPYEPAWVVTSAPPLTRLSSLFTNAWARVARNRLRRAGIFCNDVVFGLSNTGALNESLMKRFLGRLSVGVNEIYLHPAQATPVDDGVPGQQARSIELAALLSPGVRAAVESSGAQLGGYRDALGAAQNG